MFRSFRSVPRGDSFNLPGISILSNRPRPDEFGPKARFGLLELPSRQHIPSLEWCGTHANSVEVSASGFPGCGTAFRRSLFLGCTDHTPLPLSARRAHWSVVTDQYVLSATATRLARDPHATPRQGFRTADTGFLDDWSDWELSMPRPMTYRVALRGAQLALAAAGILFLRFLL